MHTQSKELDIAPEDLLVNLITDQNYMSLATCFNNKPLATTIFFAFGKAAQTGKHALYWLSSPDSKHSVQISRNPHTSVTLYDQTALQGTGFGLRFNGKARALLETDQEAWNGYYLLKDKADSFPETVHEVTSQADSLRKMYMMSISDASANGAIEFEDKRGWIDFSHQVTNEILRRAAPSPFRQI